MRYTSDDHRRYAFRDWLRAELARLDFYQRRGARYLVSEFARYADEQDAHVEEVSLGRYLREENPVLPTPESCRELAKALGRHPVEVLLEAGYLTPDDFYYMPATVNEDDLQRQMREIDRYTYLPEAIRAQMKASLARQLSQITQAQPRQPDGTTRSAVAPKPSERPAAKESKPMSDGQPTPLRPAPSGSAREG